MRVAPSIFAASVNSGLRVESAASSSTTVKGICVQICATVTDTKARVGLVSHGIEESIRPRLRSVELMMPQLGWNTQTQSTALIAPGSTHGNSMIERSAFAPKNSRLRKRAVAPPIRTTIGAEKSVK